MTTQHLQRAIEAAQTLSPREKHELIEVIARSLVQADALESRSAAFLRGRTLDELIDEQQTPIIADISTLAADFWPEEESADDINAYIYAQRHTNREPAR